MRDSERRRERRGARARVAVAVAVAGARADDVRASERRIDRAGRPRAREAALGKKWWKRLAKGLSRGATTASGALVSSTTRSWSQSYNWAADTAKEAKAVNKFGASTVNAFGVFGDREKSERLLRCVQGL